MKEKKEYESPVICVVDVTEDVILTSNFDNDEIMEKPVDHNWTW